jgi:hypothetical protein
MVRINITLPEDTLRTLDRLAKPGDRSRLIDKAVRHYASTRSAEALREQLKQASIRDRESDLEVTGEWSAADDELWQQHERAAPPAPKTGRSAAKSTSRRSTRR